jgi:hypothetical protein
MQLRCALLRLRQPRDALAMPTTEGPGMDPYRFAYSPILSRPKLSWPKGARVAVWVCPNIEHYEYLPAEVRVRNPWPRMPHPDVLGYGGRDYGNRVGLWRMFEVLDKHAIRCTVSLSMSVIEMYPEILEAMEARRWEYMSHGYLQYALPLGLLARGGTRGDRAQQGDAPAPDRPQAARLVLARRVQHPATRPTSSRRPASNTSATSTTTTSRRRWRPSTAR